ncbi:hypothetical protein SISNIDRAFT_264062 [Sistotremastrum niveocremeum HHB9708]|uniref:Uncharacterized protein n=1 Tax=Sistotremastrum niveocremeum HHB9708 TaxID=1314777 RepID=A0A164P4X2_9AGAM|nr:hypothetical protein SISNIDRAFT_264062 [Sistotremastrum niveocremeum HHB9708]
MLRCFPTASQCLYIFPLYSKGHARSCPRAHRPLPRSSHRLHATFSPHPGPNHEPEPAKYSRRAKRVGAISGTASIDLRVRCVAGILIRVATPSSGYVAVASFPPRCAPHLRDARYDATSLYYSTRISS